MTTQTRATPRPSTGAPRPARSGAPRAGSVARTWSLTRAEMLLLLRNRTTLFNALAIAPGTVAFLSAVDAGAFAGGSGPQSTGRFLIAALAAMALVFVVYYNVTTTLVARREELVLKRLLTGEASRAEVLVACAAPAVAVVLAQLALGAVAVRVWFALPPLTNVAWVALGLAGGIAVFVLLAAASSGVTRTVESAQLTTLPVVMLTVVLSGFTVPLDLLPGVVGDVAAWTPMAPVVTLVATGLGGAAPDASGWSQVTQPVLCLVLWAAAGAWAARRWMRWEPRR